MKSPLIRVLSERSFLFLWLAEVFTQVSMNMLSFVLILVAFKLSGSNTAVSGIVLTFIVPAIIFGLLAGVYVDRWNKKAVLFNTNIIRGALLLAIVVFHNNLTM
jgi:MFS family permease